MKESEVEKVKREKTWKGFRLLLKRKKMIFNSAKIKISLNQIDSSKAYYKCTCNNVIR